MSFVKILVIIMTIIAIGGVIYLVWLRRQEGEMVTGLPEMENYMPQYSGGYSSCVILDQKLGERRVIYLLRPNYDIEKELKRNPNFQPKTYPVAFDKKQVDTFSGDFSPNVTKLKGYPSDSDLLPEEIKTKMPFLVDKIEQNNQIRDTSEIYKSRMEMLKDVGMQTAGGELIVKAFSTMSEISKDLKEFVKKEDKKQFGGN